MSQQNKCFNQDVSKTLVTFARLEKLTHHPLHPRSIVPVPQVYKEKYIMYVKMYPSSISHSQTHGQLDRHMDEHYHNPRHTFKHAKSEASTPTESKVTLIHADLVGYLLHGLKHTQNTTALAITSVLVDIYMIKYSLKYFELLHIKCSRLLPIHTSPYAGPHSFRHCLLLFAGSVHTDLVYRASLQKM